MKIDVDQTFFRESEAYALRYCCEDCTLFVDERCAHFWPTLDHRRAQQSQKTSVVFCKEFCAD
ncbi:MAG: hypothetical protein H6707_09265 [Deltaproteobacteria bacterium]|nr:hypothetical protein [Deltaproteobacteria bacterium]